MLFLHTSHIWAYSCLKCVTKVYNHLVNINDLLSPTDDDCNIVIGTNGCSIQIDWFNDQMSKVSYMTNSEVSYDNILTIIERQFSFDTNQYSTRRSIVYNCRLNTMACNTIDNLKRVLSSMTTPTDQEIQQFDHLIIPRKKFNANQCAQLSNISACPQYDLTSKCQQCLSIAQYLKYFNICSTCSIEEITRNYFLHQTIILMSEVPSQLETLILACQKRGACNSIENIQQIKQRLQVKFDLEKFSHSKASSIIQSNGVLLLILLIAFLISSLNYLSDVNFLEQLTKADEMHIK